MERVIEYTNNNIEKYIKDMKADYKRNNRILSRYIRHIYKVRMIVLSDYQVRFY